MPLSGDGGEAASSKVKTPKDKAYGDFKPVQVPIAPDGGPVPGFGVLNPPARPEATEDNYICLRGPCRYFWHMVVTAGEGNPKGTWEALGVAAPREHHLTCTVHPGTETTLSFDEIVFECSLWDPITEAESAPREQRRELYQIRRSKNEPIETVPDDLKGDER